MWEECVAYVSAETLAINNQYENLQYYWSHQNTSVVAVGFGIYVYFSSLSAAAITALLASPGTMALGILGIFGLGASAGKLWNKGWTKLFSWFMG